MRQSNPKLEQEFLEYVVEVESRNQERIQNIEDKKIYIQLSIVMEALAHM
jgi:hypothetical protein